MSDGKSTTALDAKQAFLTLCLVPGVGPRILAELLDHFEDATSVLAAPPATLQKVPGVGRKLANEISLAAEHVDAVSQIRLCADNHIEIVDQFSDRYPKPLREIHDPPPVLFCRGSLIDEDALAISIVGSRHATHYGRRVAEKLSRGLANAGYTVVSGMARGIDAAAHRGALAAGGRTIAVLGSGLLNIYPAEHAELAGTIADNGAVISEFVPDRAPKGTAFPQRNRIVTGLSLGTIVVEAAERSGALISARLAMEQGREVFAVPGSIESRMSRGCHQLIRDGAKLVESIDDVLEELGPLMTPMKNSAGQTIHHPAELQLNEQESQILQAIETSPTDIDTIVERTALPVTRVLSTISVLEIRRLIRRCSGSAVVRVS